MLLGHKNQLLATLPATLYQQWGKHFVLRELKRGLSLNLKGPRQEVYFPISCVIAIYSTSVIGQPIFMRFVGPSFAAGLVNMIATDKLVFDGIVCGSGYAMTVPAVVVTRSIDTLYLSEVASSIAMARTARGSLMIAQCHGAHTYKQRLANILLQARDCFGGEQPVTLMHHSLAEMLMTRRETVTAILSEWNRDSVVESQREAIYIHRVDKLKQASCDCYSWVQQSNRDELNLWKSIRWREV
jgi:hypothetical protein